MEKKDINSARRALANRAQLLVNHFKRPFYDGMIRNVISNVYNFDTDPMLLAEVDPDPINHKAAGWRMYKHTDVRVVKATTHKAIVIPKIENPDPICRVAVLNFASAKNPGGMFLEGSAAQEETLCHNSLLYPVLEKCEEHYSYNKKNLRHGIYPHTMIYSEQVPFYDITLIPTEVNDEIEFRTKDLLQSTMSKSFIQIGSGCTVESVPIDISCLVEDISSDADVITCAAPNFNAYELYIHRGLNGEDKDVIRKAYFDIFDAMRTRIHYIFRVALAHGVSDLILGAWGCGVFGWDPSHVASLFRYEIEKYWMCQFRSILFAVPTTAGCGYRRSVTNQNTFKVIFSIMTTDEIDSDGGPLQYWHALYGKDREITKYFQQYMDDLIQSDLSKCMETTIHNEAHSDTVEQ